MLSLFLGCLLATTLRPTGEAAPRDAARVRTILMLGDSLTDGYGLERNQAYPALVAAKLREGGYRFDVINAGVSGDTTAGGLRRLPTFLRKRIDVLVLELGINDVFRGIPLDEIRSNLQTIIDLAKKQNPQVQVLIAGMQLPVADEGDYMRAFGELFRVLAEKNHAALIPYLLAGVGGEPSLNLGDHIHPNAAGQRVLAETVWQALNPFLEPPLSR